MTIRFDFSNNYYFGDSVFNPKTRIIVCENVVYQLRKKENDALLLLCSKYPEPVTHEEFLELVWQGCYVTPQSIAQVIHSLRKIVNDNSRSVIVTLPKLGYKINVPASDFSTKQNDNRGVENLDSQNVSVENSGANTADLITEQSTTKFTSKFKLNYFLLSRCVIFLSGGVALLYSLASMPQSLYAKITMPIVTAIL